jgi:hypothetical protein
VANQEVELMQPREVEMGGKRRVGAPCNPTARVSESWRNSSGVSYFAPWKEEGWRLAAMGTSVTPFLFMVPGAWPFHLSAVEFTFLSVGYDFPHNDTLSAVALYQAFLSIFQCPVGYQR